MFWVVPRFFLFVLPKNARRSRSRVGALALAWIRVGARVTVRVDALSWFVKKNIQKHTKPEKKKKKNFIWYVLWVKTGKGASRNQPISTSVSFGFTIVLVTTGTFLGYLRTYVHSAVSVKLRRNYCLLTWSFRPVYTGSSLASWVLCLYSGRCILEM